MDSPADGAFRILAKVTNKPANKKVNEISRCVCSSLADSGEGGCVRLPKV